MPTIRTSVRALLSVCIVVTWSATKAQSNDPTATVRWGIFCCLKKIDCSWVLQPAFSYATVAATAFRALGFYTEKITPPRIEPDGGLVDCTPDTLTARTPRLPKVAVRWCCADICFESEPLELIPAILGTLLGVISYAESK